MAAGDKEEQSTLDRGWLFLAACPHTETCETLPGPWTHVHVGLEERWREPWSHRSSKTC